MSFKGLAVAGAMLFATKYLLRKMLPGLGAYETPAAAIAAGAIGKFTGIGGSKLIGYGLIDGASEFAADLIAPGGYVTLPGLGGGVSKGGYDL